ncbi:carbohydrate ABC transporter permease [Devosia aquimaris]|uniref:carbohydrate ABC transporter permease n=1 Tax=Devosia aquimaris TaxID=2866214 RepID=UPI001CD0966C|nr:sugar ABC transporter permease [Devosia sp. CJK-A8-3]
MFRIALWKQEPSPWRAATAWLFVAPFMTIFVVFTAVPAVLALIYSFTDIGVADIRHPLDVDFVSFQTFARVLTNPGFLKSVWTTALFVLIGVPLTMMIGLALAIGLNSGITKLRATYRAAFYLPVITNIVAAAVIWQYAFTLSGPVNSMLEAMGATGPNWLGDPRMAMPTVIMLAVWRNIGTCMVLFLAGLQAIPSDVYEAARIDGASAWRRFSAITLPLLKPATLLVTVLMTVSFMNIFDEPYLVTKGGPLSSTKSVALWVYEQFGQGNIAPAMAGSYVMLAIVVVLGVLQLRLLRAH